MQNHSLFCPQRSTHFPALYKRELSGTSPRNHVRNRQQKKKIASKAPAGDGNEACLRNLALLTSISCQLRTSTGPLTALSMQATKRPCDALKGSWRFAAYGFGYLESQLLQDTDTLNRGLHFWKNKRYSWNDALN